MSRVMIDTTHNGLPGALSAIKALADGDIVALYDTGSVGIAATPSDIAQIPARLHTVFIDQGFTGSPNLKADIRDCENGAWQLNKAVNRTGWNVPRPTLYLGFPDTVQEAFDAGWRGDVWLVHPSTMPPTAPPNVPPGINVVAVQWGFFNHNFDRSVVFDRSWPMAATDPVTPVPPGQWLNPKGWEWHDVVVAGVGMDGKFHAFHLVNNAWVKLV
jgi:hypothetical protein